MAKRPRYAAHLQTAQIEPPATGERVHAAAQALVVEQQGSGSAMLPAIAPQPESPSIAGVGGPQESLTGIIGDAIVTMSVAMFNHWQQGVTLQMRLCAYMFDPRQTRTFGFQGGLEARPPL